MISSIHELFSMRGKFFQENGINCQWHYEPICKYLKQNIRKPINKWVNSICGLFYQRICMFSFSVQYNRQPYFCLYKFKPFTFVPQHWACRENGKIMHLEIILTSVWLATLQLHKLASTAHLNSSGGETPLSKGVLQICNMTFFYFKYEQ